MVKAYYSYKLEKSIGCGSTSILPHYQHFIYKDILCTYTSAEDILSLVSIQSGEVLKQI